MDSARRPDRLPIEIPTHNRTETLGPASAPANQRAEWERESPAERFLVPVAAAPQRAWPKPPGPAANQAASRCLLGEVETRHQPMRFGINAAEFEWPPHGLTQGSNVWHMSFDMLTLQAERPSRKGVAFGRNAKAGAQPAPAPPRARTRPFPRDWPATESALGASNLFTWQH